MKSPHLVAVTHNVPTLQSSHASIWTWAMMHYIKATLTRHAVHSPSEAILYLVSMFLKQRMAIIKYIRLNQTSTTLLHAMETEQHPHVLYRTKLICMGYGYPLRYPEPDSSASDEYMKKGVQPGDVGGS